MSATEPMGEKCVADTIRTLAMDAVQAARSGHPGMPMGMADAATVLWGRYLCVDPSQPNFPDRDRFVLSAGHGSMLLYGLLHLAGFDLPMEELKHFRQLGSRTPGHPEVGHTPGVETTTGPLGQGFANAVGMAMAEERLAAWFNRPGFPVVDHYSYGICSDGDLQEGISHEAASLAGHHQLGKLILLYDDNSITIDGATELSYSEDATGRFEAYGWHVQEVDGHDRDAVGAAIEAARDETGRPSLIRCRTHIGYGSPNKQDSAASHGAPLGEEEIRLTKRAYGWPEDSAFEVPDAARDGFGGLRGRGEEKGLAWRQMMNRYREAHPDLGAAWDQLETAGGLPDNLDALLPGFDSESDAIATRAASGAVLNALAEAVPALWGGSADLAGSNNTLIKGADPFLPGDRTGRNLYFGIREHGMAGIMNGMALHGGVIPYGGTFLTFSDYMRGSMRLAALMKQRVVYVLTHDSIFLGEDGPTHQSVEHAEALRSIPGMHVMRPADTRETSAAWAAALRRTDGPTALLLTRQGLPQLQGSTAALEGTARGGYVVWGAPDTTPDLVLLATGSEVHLAVEAAETLTAEGRQVRVVSMPCVDRFLEQDDAYQDQVLPPACLARISVEAGRTNGWSRFVGPLGLSIGIDTFGESAPAKDLALHFGFTTEQVLEAARGLLASFPARVQAHMANLRSILETSA